MPHFSIIKATEEEGNHKHAILSVLEGFEEATKENLLKELRKAVDDFKQERQSENEALEKWKWEIEGEGYGDEDI